MRLRFLFYSVETRPLRSKSRLTWVYNPGKLHSKKTHLAQPTVGPFFVPDDFPARMGAELQMRLTRTVGYFHFQTDANQWHTSHGPLGS